MSLFLLRDGLPEGPFAESLVRAWLVSGKCSKDDLARREEGQEWQPLSELIRDIGKAPDSVTNLPSENPISGRWTVFQSFSLFIAAIGFGIAIFLNVTGIFPAVPSVQIALRWLVYELGDSSFGILPDPLSALGLFLLLNFQQGRTRISPALMLMLSGLALLNGAVNLGFDAIAPLFTLSYRANLVVIAAASVPVFAILVPHWRHIIRGKLDTSPILTSDEGSHQLFSQSARWYVQGIFNILVFPIYLFEKASAFAARFEIPAVALAVQVALFIAIGKFTIVLYVGAVIIVAAVVSGIVMAVLFVFAAIVSIWILYKMFFGGDSDNGPVVERARPPLFDPFGMFTEKEKEPSPFDPYGLLEKRSKKEFGARDPIILVYDLDGKQIGTIEMRKDIFGQDYMARVGMDGKEVSTSHDHEDIRGNHFEQTLDQDGKPLHYSETRVDRFGEESVVDLTEDNRKLIEIDDDHRVVGSRKLEKDRFGNPYWVFFDRNGKPIATGQFS